MINPLPLVIADMQRTRSGVLALTALIAVAVALGVAVSAQERALRLGSNQAAAPFDLLIGAPGSETQLLLSTVYLQPAAVDLLPGRILYEVSQQQGVEYAAPIGFGDSYRGYPIVGTTAQFATLDGSLALQEGRIFTNMTGAVIGADVKLTLQDEFSPNHGQVLLDEDEEDAAHGNFSYRVVGKLARRGSPWDRAIVVPVESLWRLHALPTGHTQHRQELAEAGREKRAIDWSKLLIGPPWDVDELPGVPAIAVKPASVRAAYVLRNDYRRNDATMAIFPAEVLLQLYALLGDARFLFATMAIATQVLVIGAILLAVFAALALRRRQLGVLRALGASRGYIFSVIWLTIVAIIAAGALLGLLLGWLLAVVLSGWVGGQTGLDLPVSLTAKEFSMAAALIGLGLLLAVIPSATAYRQSPAALLRD